MSFFYIIYTLNNVYKAFSSPSSSEPPLHVLLIWSGCHPNPPLSPKAFSGTTITRKVLTMDNVIRRWIALCSASQPRSSWNKKKGNASLFCSMQSLKKWIFFYIPMVEKDASLLGSQSISNKTKDANEDVIESITPVHLEEKKWQNFKFYIFELIKARVVTWAAATKDFARLKIEDLRTKWKASMSSGKHRTYQNA